MTDLSRWLLVALVTGMTIIGTVFLYMGGRTFFDAGLADAYALTTIGAVLLAGGIIIRMAALPWSSWPTTMLPLVTAMAMLGAGALMLWRNSAPGDIREMVSLASNVMTIVSFALIAWLVVALNREKRERG